MWHVMDRKGRESRLPSGDEPSRSRYGGRFGTLGMFRRRGPTRATAAAQRRTWDLRILVFIFFRPRPPIICVGNKHSRRKRTATTLAKLHRPHPVRGWSCIAPSWTSFFGSRKDDRVLGVVRKGPFYDADHVLGPVKEVYWLPCPTPAYEFR